MYLLTISTASIINTLFSVQNLDPHLNTKLSKGRQKAQNNIEDHLAVKYSAFLLPAKSIALFVALSYTESCKL